MDTILSTELERQKRKLLDLVNAAKAFISLQCINLEDLIKQKIALDRYIRNMSKMVDRYVSVVPSPSEELATSCYQLMSEGQDIMIEFEALVECQRNKPQPSAKNTKLPQLTLPKWGGNILEFNQFFDRFQSSLGLQDISDVDKLSYLLGCLEGSALQAVQGIATTNVNYLVAIDTLKRRFGDKGLVIDAHYKALSKLSRCKYDAEDCRKNFNDIERHLRILQSLGEDINSNHLRSLILDKFPERVLYEVNILCPEDKTVARIKEELNKIITAMELSRMKLYEIPLASPSSSSTEVLHTHQTLRAKGEVALSRQAWKTETNKHKIFDNKKYNNGTKQDKTTKKRRKSCIFCSGAHYNDECTIVTRVKERENKLKNRCYNCFSQGHNIKECRRPKRCYHCKGPHNRALCPKKVKGRSTDKLESQVLINIRNPKGTSYLQTATAWVVNNNKKRNCRILLDCGSQRSYITQGLAKHLNMTPEGEDLLTIFTFGEDKPKETLSPSVDINLETRRGIQRNITVNIVPHITDRLPIPDYGNTELVDIWADDGTAGHHVDVLIGNDYYFSFLKNEIKSIDSNLYLINTTFGWVMSGHLNCGRECRNNDVLSVVTYHETCNEIACFTEPDVPLKNMDIKFLWSLENIGITDSVKANRQDEAVQHFNKTCEYRDGRYYVKWPWTEYPPKLPTNFGLAYGRLKGLLMRQDSPTIKEYDDILRDQLEAGIIERVEVQGDPTCQSQPPIHYLAHHMVKQAGKQGRIVYDASAKTKDQSSLNECMFRGPCMLQDLTALLINFRVNKVAIVADVEKAFLQVGLQEEDREVTRFIWVKDIEKALSNDNILHLRFCRVPFGIIASPFLLTSVIRYHIASRDRNLLDHIANKFYVDNLVTGASSTEAAKCLFETCKKLFEELSMNLRDWSSNDKELIAQIPERNRIKHKEQEKVLGLIWKRKEDTLRLNFNEETFECNKKINKREVLRTIASIYDPCGIVSPLILPAKLFLQKLWFLDYKWDVCLPIELVSEWKTILLDIKNIRDIIIPRYVGTQNDRKEIEYQLHCFTDASNYSYSAAVYLRADDGHEVKTQLLMSKCRVVPLERGKGSKGKSLQKGNKTLTIPQLELLGYLIGSRLLAYTKRTIILQISSSYLWTDSLIVLGWVKSNKLLTTWVTNRVTEIRKNDIEMCYVNTKENPADLATRPGVELGKLKTVWLQGPDFLSEPKVRWPCHNFMEAQVTVSAVVEGLEGQPPDIQQLPNEVQSGIESRRTSEERMDSEVQLIKEIQREYFPEEIKGKETHLSRNLGLFKDIDGILRCGGRMFNTDWPYEMRHPILLPKDCEYTNKLILDTHRKNYHVGVSHALSIIRRNCWIPQGRSQVQKVLKRCPQCVKHGGGPYRLPSTPALPPERVKYEAPFAFTGLDYLGPIFVKSDNGKDKRWVCLYTCLVVRSVHLEVVKDLTAEECLSAFRRFAATRGIPKLVLSDNALQFKLTAEVMTGTYCIENKIRWRFTPELAPWHGGVYERLVAVVKNCLKRSLEKHLLNDTQLSTVIKEVEAVVNTRPLTCVSSDPDYILRPVDFLSLGKRLTMNPSVEDEQTLLRGSSTKHDLIYGWRLGLTLIKEFKEMFIGQYLTGLRERYRNSPKQPRVKSCKEPRVGDLVQIKGEHKNRQNWKVGNISSLVQGADGEYRVAKIKVGNVEFTRSIGHLYPLEADIEGDEDTIIRRTIREPELTPEINELGVCPRLEVMVSERAEESNISTQEDEVEIVDQQENTENNRERERESVGEGNNVLEQMYDHELPPPDVEMDIDNQHVEEDTPTEDRVRRVAAVRAREKIREWTSQLMALL